jgi:uncharacterized Ntn-hydrolase superfamily protein
VAVTWSIIARDEPTGRVGIVVATRFFAVGAMVPHVRTGVGAVATQAFINPLYGPQGLALIEGGLSAEETACIDWCGHAIRPNFSIAGNMLAGPAVLADTIAAYEAESALPFARRLIVSMQAGEAAGGDKRGKQSAALLIHDGQDYPLYDLRVDDHADPLTELARLLEVARERWVHFRRWMPSRENPSGLVDRSGLEALVARSIAEGYE